MLSECIRCLEETNVLCEISDFCREADESRVLLGCYAGCSGDSLPMCRDKLSDSPDRYTLRNSLEERSFQQTYFTRS